MGDINVAIVGEGPTGLMAVAKLIRLATENKSDKKLNLTWFIARPTHIRRHVINISKDFLIKLQDILYDCHKCISKNVGENSPSELSMSIRTLEYIMFQKINESIDSLNKPNNNKGLNSDQLNIIKSGRFNYDEDVRRFHHVFFCDGAWSGGRNKVLFSPDNPFEMITYQYKSPIIILYSGLGPRIINNNWNPSNNMHSDKVYLSNTQAKKHDISLQEMYDLLAILYNIRKNIVIAEDIPTQDLWATGYSTRAELEGILIHVGSYLSRLLDTETVENVVVFLKSKGAFVSKTQINLLTNIKTKKQPVDSLLQKVFAVVDSNISSTDNLILSPVLPKISTNGIALGDKNSPNLRYSLKMGDTYCYLLGDSANAFPPGYSLEISLKSCVEVMEVFYSHFIGNSHPKPFPNWEFTSPCNNKESVSTGCFWGGYPRAMKDERGAGNKFCKTLSGLKTRIQNQYFDRIKDTDDPFIVEYNKYEFNLFVYYATFLLCQGGFQHGGRRKTRYHKVKRRITKRKNLR